MSAVRQPAGEGHFRAAQQWRAYNGRRMRMVERRGAFEIAWEEPPVIGYKWKMTITSDDPRLFALVHRSVVTLIAPTRERAISDAREFVEFIHEQVVLGPTRRARR